MDRELTLHHHLEGLRKENYESLNDYFRINQYVMKWLPLAKLYLRTASPFGCSMDLVPTTRCSLEIHLDHHYLSTLNYCLCCKAMRAGI